MTAIVWFRRDLRLADNPALSAAAAHGAVLPVFLPEDEDHNGEWASGSASRVWLHESLKQLNTSLGGRLLLLAGRSDVALPALVKQCGATALFYNRRYEPAQRLAEQRLKKALGALPLHEFDGNVLRPPEVSRTKSGGIYKVFTPFYQHAYLSVFALSPPAAPLPAPALRMAAAPPLPPALMAEPLPAPPAWGRKILACRQPGEKGANTRADEFAGAAGDYARRRDLPGEDGVSRLSPHLHFGEISPRQLWARLDDAGGAFLRQLIWREFSVYLLHHFPDFCDRSWRREFDNFAWRDDEDALKRWQQGETGIPIIDAAMRELHETGYMHNRARMITASFLTKNLMLHWRHGARWFWEHLADADLANNSAGWQWVAGSGADAAPYFRIFNPLLQSEKFDRAGDYLARYLPALRALPPRERHRPWLSHPGRFPAPMVSLEDTRRRALAAYQAMKK